MALNTRAIAAAALSVIIGHGKSLDTALTAALEPVDDPRDRAFIQELVYGVLRWYWRLLPQLHSLLRRPLRSRDRAVEMLLLIGLYQLQYLSTPPYAAVATTVEACDGLNKAWASGLVNGVLRNAVRLSPKLGEIALQSVAGRSAHPEWFVRALQRDWPERWQAMLAADNEYPPLTLRVNSRRTSRARYLELLAAAGIDARATRYAEHGIRLAAPVAVAALPEFLAGHVSIQDEAAQLAAPLLEVSHSARVLDACAAPGGKTGHLLEMHDALRIVAVDRSERRLEMLTGTLRRLGLHAVVHAADVAAIDEWWDGEPFDRILLDAPCSASGVIRRHPDIKVRRRPVDVQDLVKQQRHLLNSLWPLLKAGGKLIYGTCSVLRIENDGVVSRFVGAGDGIRIDRIAADWGTATDCGRQIITGEENMDGFYYARLIKE